MGIALLVLVLAASAAAWVWVNYTRQGEAAYSLLQRRIEERTGHTPSPARGYGAIMGTVRDERGQPLEGATVVASDRYGAAVSTRTGADGGYVLSGVSPGRVVPAAAHHGYEDAVYRRYAWLPPTAVWVRAARAVSGVDFAMTSLADEARTPTIERGETVIVEDDYPWEVQAERTEFTVTRDGFAFQCWVYEPVTPELEGRLLPGIVAVYPGPPLNWEPPSIAFVAQGYVVVGFAPISMRGADVVADVADLRMLIGLFGHGELSQRVDGGRLAAFGGSFSSVALLRALQPSSDIRAVVSLGGLADVYRLRYDAYQGDYDGYTISQAMEYAMWSMGRPDRVPRMYIENSVIYHVEGLPPLCLIHSTHDAIVPYNQSELLAEVLQRAGQPHELHIYYETGHYPGIYDPDPDTEAMYREMVRFFEEHLTITDATGP